MYGKTRTKGQVRFAFTPPASVGQVHVAGDFTDWQPLRMRRQPSGSFVCRAELPQTGAHEYKFLVDDEWTTDPDNDRLAVNPFGTFNSVAVLE